MSERSNLNLPNQIQAMLDGSLPPPPIAKLIGFKLVSIGSGKAVIEFEATERHANPMGTLHGGVLCDVGDAAMGMAYASMLNDGETFTTLELKINFLKPVWRAKLRAEAGVVEAGKVVGLVMCDVFDEKERLVARASCTCMTLRGDQAGGR
ncbi:MAG: PaaI family thioesterase [Syntrophobacteraceae bacterium]